MIHKDVVSELRNSLTALISIRDKDPNIIDEIERKVYESLSLKEVGAFDYNFIYASLGSRVDASSDIFNESSVCIHIPDLNSYLYFSSK